MSKGKASILNDDNEFLTHNENNYLINKIYDNDNYFVKINDNGQKDLCYIFFSSNGLYNANDKFAFEEKIINEDRYEWINLTENINAYKKIYIRDIWLSWYVKGINSKIDSIDLLVEWLKKETKDYRVRIVGMSSGGYIGALIGTMINAEMCFCFSGQFSLENHNNHVNDNMLLNKYYKSRGHWYEIYNEIKNSPINIVYFFPEYVDHDKIQSYYVEGFENVISVGFKSKIHAKTIFNYDYQRLLEMDINEVRNLIRNINKLPTSALKFSYKINGPYRASKLLLKKILRKISNMTKF